MPNDLKPGDVLTEQDVANLKIAPTEPHEGNYMAYGRTGTRATIVELGWDEETQSSPVVSVGHCTITAAEPEHVGITRADAGDTLRLSVDQSYSEYEHCLIYGKEHDAPTSSTEFTEDNSYDCGGLVNDTGKTTGDIPASQVQVGDYVCIIGYDLRDNPYLLAYGTVPPVTP